jgi:hypothetical protein
MEVHFHTAVVINVCSRREAKGKWLKFGFGIGCSILARDEPIAEIAD